MREYKKYITVVDYIKIDQTLEDVPHFGVTVFAKNKREANLIAPLFNLKKTVELCVVLETQEVSKFYSDN